MAEEPIVYTPEDYTAMDMGDYRKKYPDETEPLSDKQLFDTVMSTEDDYDDQEWRALFLAVGQATADAA